MAARRRLAAALTALLRRGCLRGDDVDADTVELVAEAFVEELGGEDAPCAPDAEGAQDAFAELLVDTVAGYVGDTGDLMDGWENEAAENVEDMLDSHVDLLLAVRAAAGDDDSGGGGGG